MFLTQLEIFGFKSFPTKLDLRFGDGITGIVGPNGCGKTNIVDAIRWVLGEQKPSLLRSEHMEDVIFNGTARRKPLGMAEVSLIVDNSRGSLAQEYTEVMITRRLFRSGESEYLLNKTPCRRRDIVELFMDTGMGPHAYSVIELSMVESILSGNTEALRVLFEEAAGIAKYKAKRREALRKLETTKLNLFRVADILEEVEKQVSGLRRQAAKAKRYQHYLQELKDHEIAVASAEYLQRKGEIRQLLEVLKKVQSRADRSGEQLSEQEEQAEQLRRQLTQCEESLTSLRAALTEKGEHIHKLDELILVGQERKEGLGQQLARNHSDVETLQTKLEALIQEKKNREEETARSNEAFTSAEENFAQKEEKLAMLDRDLFEKRAAVEKAGSQVSELLQERDHVRGEKERLQAQWETTERREQKLSQEAAKTIGETEQVARLMRAAKEKLRKVHRKSQQLEAQLQKALDNRSQLLTSLEKLTEEERELEGQVEICKHRLQLLQGIFDAYEGYHQGVKTLAADSGVVPGTFQTVANSLEVDQKYVRAVEAVLGEAAQYLLVDTTEVALKAVAHLRRQRAGRATFLILDRVGQLAATPKPKDALSQQGTLAWAPDVVTCDPKYRPAVDFLLGKVVIIDSLDRLRKGLERNAERYVTWVSLSGDVLEAQTMLRGGHLAEQSGLLDRQQKIRQESDSLDLLVATLQEKHNQRLQLESHEKGSSQKISQLQRAHQVQTTEKTRLEKEVETLELQSKTLLQRQADIATELKELRRQARPHEKLMAQLTQKLSQLQNQLSEKGDRHRHLEKELGQLESGYRTILKEINEARVQLVSLQSRCEQLRLDKERWGEIEKDVTSNLESRKAEIQQIQKRIESLTKEIATKAQEVGDQKAQSSEKKAEVDLITGEESSIRETLHGLEFEIKKVREERESAQKQVHDIQLQLAEIEAKQEAAVERIQEEYQFNLRVSLDSGEVEETSLQERKERIQFLRERIRTGEPVNLTALDEYNAHKERYDFLSEQRDDLLRAEENLNQVIKEMNRRARRLFASTFRKVNRNFQAIFHQMFDGGEANLILDGKGDPLEANIEIYACPGGKRLRHIAQLSGGEKALTAISLLFSLYQVKPSPFCVLDEVDAPLDDVNIDRFVEMLKSLSQNSQFIIITHNKNTMAAADVLYGVTMGESGVSKVVSVNLRQAEKAQHK